MRIKRLTDEQLTRLHELEAQSDERWRAAVDRDSREKLSYPELRALRGEGWGAVGERYLQSLEHLLPTFWPPRLSESDRFHAVEAWRANKQVRYACVLANDVNKTELAALHAADLHHWRYGPVLGPRQTEPVEPTGGRHDYAHD